jgi:hypothetical protein
MNGLIIAWKVTRGDLYYLNRSINVDQRNLLKKMDQEIASLCRIVLHTSKGIEITTKEFRRKGSLTVAVGFDLRRGLLLLANGVEYKIADSQDVLSGRVAGLEEIQKIQRAIHAQNTDCLDRDGQKNVDYEPRTVDRVIRTRENQETEPSLVSRLRSLIDWVTAGTDVSSFAKNVAQAISPSAIAISSPFAFLAGLLFAIGGLAMMVSSFASLQVSFAHNQLEKMGLSLLDFLSGFSSLGLGITFILEQAAICVKTVGSAMISAVSVMFPIFLFGLFVTGLASAVYKTYQGLCFRSQLKQIVGDGTCPKRLFAALMWMKEQTQYCQSDNGIRSSLHEKWDRFALRVEEPFKIIPELLKTELANDLLDGLMEGKEESINKAKEMVLAVLQANLDQLKWNGGMAVAHLVGAIGIALYAALMSHIAPLVSSILFSVLAFLFLFADSLKFRKSVQDSIAWAIDLYAPRVTQFLRKFLNQKEQEDRSCPPELPISSTSSDQRRGWLETPFFPILEIYPHLLLS